MQRRGGDDCKILQPRRRGERSVVAVRSISPERGMSRAGCGGGGGEEERCRYRGVRRRRWGKWVSEIRVPGTRERLWLGSYATPEAAAVAHDTAVYFLRGSDSGGASAAAALNFPERAAAAYGAGAVAAAPLSPRSVQRVASDAGMAADAQLVAARDSAPSPSPAPAPAHPGHVVAVIGAGATAARHGMYAARALAGGSTRTSGGEQQLVCAEEISVDDMEIFDVITQ
ncbi:ethylene-responsive transcription factor ERF039-like [Oryza brachyantha]|uniref:ethylene-responsive transcription factor ERF039-like n=1 Tax=Oryza brachyantha TaxID=4533 RepID=UPI001AD9CF32|nr:ethylene-responsive transcription factor ERF039-like [Oryza brachyantha]